MIRRRLLALVLPVAVIGGFALSAPAYAAQQSGLGTTLDVTIQPGAQSALEESAWLPLGGGTAIADTGDPVAADTTLTITEGATTLMTCTIPSGNTQCGDTVTAIDAGANNVVYTFDNGTSTVAFNGVLFGVTVVAPSVSIEWQDADGDWINGDGTAVPLLASTNTVGRCIITNNSNAVGTLAGFTGNVSHPVDPTTVVPLTGTIAAGASQTFTLYSGPAGNLASYSCSGGINFPSGTGGSGNGQGGTVVPIAGTLSTSALTIDPGETVTITGSGLLPPLSSTFSVTVNGAPAPGSPTALVMPNGDIDFDVAFPTAGTYTLGIHNDYSSRVITFATFTVVVGAAELADSGVDESAALTLAGLLVLSGATLLVVRRRL